MNNLYIAKVIDNDSNNSPDKTPNGKIQIYIESLHRDINKTLYPWASPAREGTGGIGTYGVSCIPEIDSFIWIFFEDEKYYRNAFYIWDVNLSQLNPHNLYNDNVKSSVSAASSYPYVKYIYLKNKICLAISSDSSNPEITIYHPKTYLFIDKNGYLTYKDNNSNQIVINNSGISITDKNSNKVEMTSSGTKITDKNSNIIEMGTTSVKINNNLEILQ